jgi:hypothetical protein
MYVSTAAAQGRDFLNLCTEGKIIKKTIKSLLASMTAATLAIACLTAHRAEEGPGRWRRTHVSNQNHRSERGQFADSQDKRLPISALRLSR